MIDDRSPAAIGARLRDLRNKRGFTAAEIAKRLNVTPSAVSQWENGKKPPRQDFLQPLADALLTHAGYILTGEGEPDQLPRGEFRIPDAAVYVINQARERIAEALGIPIAAVRVQISFPVQVQRGPFFEIAD